MRLLIAAGYVRSDVWRREAWIPAIARALAREGLDVTVAAEGVADRAHFEPVRVLVRTPRATRTRQRALRLRAWIRELAPDYDRVLTTIPACAGHLRLDLCGSLGDGLAAIFERPNPFRIAAQAISHPYLPETALAELLARVDGARAARFRIGEDSPVVSPLDDAQGDWAADDADVTALMGVAADATVVLLSSVHMSRGGVPEFLRGFSVSQAMKGATLVMVGPGGFQCERAAQRAGLAGRVRILGPTRMMSALIRRSDLAVAAGESRGRGSGRFVADCLGLGIPVLADAGAPGARALGEVLGTGFVVDGGAEQWRMALDAVMEAGAMRVAREGASAASSRFDVCHLAKALRARL